MVIEDKTTQGKPFTLLLNSVSLYYLIWDCAGDHLRCSSAECSHVMHFMYIRHERLLLWCLWTR